MDDLRADHFYRVGDKTPYGQTIEYDSLPQCWSQVQAQSEQRFDELLDCADGSCSSTTDVHAVPGGWLLTSSARMPAKPRRARRASSSHDAQPGPPSAEVHLETR